MTDEPTPPTSSHRAVSFPVSAATARCLEEIETSLRLCYPDLDASPLPHDDGMVCPCFSIPSRNYGLALKPLTDSVWQAEEYRTGRIVALAPSLEALAVLVVPYAAALARSTRAGAEDMPHDPTPLRRRTIH
jgi:hypothetical protein